MLKKYINADFIDTSESYSDKLFLGSERNIVIPYIALNLLPQNPVVQKRAIIDYSYFIFINIESVIIKGNGLNLCFKYNTLSNSKNIVEYIMVGGYRSDDAVEIEIQSENNFLFIPPNSKFGDYPCPFMPIDTPNFSRNMNVDEVEAFFDISNLPSQLREILGENICATSIC